MSNPFIGEIRMFAGNFAPAGWAFCDGALISISQNDALFVVLGTTYGGDGEETFALPDLRGRFPLHQGNGFTLGEKGGTETVTLTVSQIPSHSHAVLCNDNSGTQTSPKNNTFARGGGGANFYVDPASLPANTTMNAAAMVPTGGSQPHDNMAPFLVVSFIISLFGIFPTQS